jgi:hypothetical protein
MPTARDDRTAIAAQTWIINGKSIMQERGVFRSTTISICRNNIKLNYRLKLSSSYLNRQLQRDGLASTDTDA